MLPNCTRPTTAAEPPDRMVSVVVPAFNEEKLIVSTLRAIHSALAAYVDAGWRTEIVVCNNNSTDATGELASREGALVVFEPVNQISRARNRGAEAAHGDWLIFVDADSQPSRELFADVAQAMESADCVGGGSTVTMPDRRWWARGLIRVWNGISRTCSLMAGSFIFCRARDFAELGGFSRQLYVAEEIDFSNRLRSLGRARGQRIRILHAHPLQTSARKLDLYSPLDYLRLLRYAALDGGRSYRDPKRCHMWYDGRR